MNVYQRPEGNYIMGREPFWTKAICNDVFM